MADGFHQICPNLVIILFDSMLIDKDCYQPAHTSVLQVHAVNWFEIAKCKCMLKHYFRFHCIVNTDCLKQHAGHVIARRYGGGGDEYQGVAAEPPEDINGKRKRKMS